MSSEVRQRKGTKEYTVNDSESTIRKPKSFSITEVGRLVTFLFLSSCMLSWFVTRDNFFWGHQPSLTYAKNVWSSLIVCFSCSATYLLPSLPHTIFPLCVYKHSYTLSSARYLRLFGSKNCTHKIPFPI